MPCLWQSSADCAHGMLSHGPDPLAWRPCSTTNRAYAIVGFQTCMQGHTLVKTWSMYKKAQARINSSQTFFLSNPTTLQQHYHTQHCWKTGLALARQCLPTNNNQPQNKHPAQLMLVNSRPRHCHRASDLEAVVTGIPYDFRAQSQPSQVRLRL